jgi:hypothetical protein
MISYVAIAFLQTATVYGFGESNCGDPGKARPCAYGALTATGDVFDPREISAAIPMPKHIRVREMFISVKNYRGFCIKIKVNDKKHWRFIGKSGFDLSPAAVKAITGQDAKKYWSGKIKPCK